jgi:hypothetical protein
VGNLPEALEALRVAGFEDATDDTSGEKVLLLRVQDDMRSVRSVLLAAQDGLHTL